ncbi:hypothetical protein MH215_10110 [Paenibacillus sp. ACRSA]|uniref:hypothetical protein n=1 Tax=Paenibacillus sp. ACRSA TaxID=2918211 RepID=UPI001EF5E291|nr:hypothetical protein [Paenibacillus sp. ACRSA]MCG7377349.1 hypothetical protein [Paenibacillus sp. ACRSA]
MSNTPRFTVDELVDMLRKDVAEGVSGAAVALKDVEDYIANAKHGKSGADGVLARKEHRHLYDKYYR